MLYARPARISCTGRPREREVATSVSMNTVHCLPRSAGERDFMASSAKCSLMEIPSDSACSSRKEPVPAAQILFMAKSLIPPSLTETNLESWPPISMIVSTSGQAYRAPRSWQVISLVTTSAPSSLPARCRPLPVVPTPRMCSLPLPRSRRISRPSRSTAIGSPLVGRYMPSSTSPAGEKRQKSVDTEPRSTPR